MATTDLEIQAQETLAVAEEAARGCRDETTWVHAMDDASAAIADLTVAVEGAEPHAQETGWAEGLIEDIRDALIFQEGCSAGFSAAAGAGLDIALAAAGRATGAYDDLRLAITGDPPTTASDLWYHSDQIGHAVELQRLSRDDGPVEILVIGSSTSKRGFDSQLLTEALGRSTMNAAVAGLFPATVEPWLQTALDVADHPRTVVLGVSSFQDFLSCDDARPTEARAVASRQAGAFAPVSALSASPGVLRLIGGPAATYRSAALDEYQPAPAARGLAPSSDRPDPVAIERQMTLYRPQLGRGRYCQRNRDAIAHVVSDLRASGHGVMVVSLPVSPTMFELHPDGRAGHDVAVDGYREATEEAGGDWLDLTDILTQGQFTDLTHATHTGRVRVSEAVAAALS